MNADQITLVRDSWVRLLPIGEQVARMFYTRLFDCHPELHAYFKGDMTTQGRKLMTMLGTAVNALDDTEALAPALRASGRAHAGYGVRPEDYDKVGAAFLWTIEQGLGEASTPAVKEAWAATYADVARLMIEGAERPGLGA